MGSGVNRRSLLKQGLTAAGGLVTALALPTRAFAQASSLTPYERRVLDIAAREASRLEAVLWRKDLVGVADFARPSSLPRLHFANLEAGTVHSHLVAHGRGSDPEHCGWLKNFSNDVGSEATSRGAFLTCETYSGKYGSSIRLRGLDMDNSNAHDRAIVSAAWGVPAVRHNACDNGALALRQRLLWKNVPDVLCDALPPHGLSLAELVAAHARVDASAILFVSGLAASEREPHGRVA